MPVPVKLVGDEDGVVSLEKMQDGDIAVIVGWGYSSCLGAIVQRYHDDLIYLGKGWGSCWPGVFKGFHKECFVRILKKGVIELG